MPTGARHSGPSEFPPASSALAIPVFEGAQKKSRWKFSLSRSHKIIEWQCEDYHVYQTWSRLVKLCSVNSPWAVARAAEEMSLSRLAMVRENS
jgi:hypothetical protein